LFSLCLKKFIWEQQNLGGKKDGDTVLECPPQWLRACSHLPPANRLPFSFNNQVQLWVNSITVQVIQPRSPTEN